MVLTSSFLLYMPVFAALAGVKVALYRPLQAPAGGKVITAGGKVLYHPLELLYRPLENLTSKSQNSGNHLFLDVPWETTKKCSKKAKIYFVCP
jgi:hypothetical protein